MEDDEPICGVYCITNTITGQVYIGSTLDLVNRFTGHIRALGRGNHDNPRLQADWDQYGAPVFTFELIEEISTDIPARIAAEERWLALAASLPPGVYNRFLSCKSLRRKERPVYVVHRQRCAAIHARGQCKNMVIGSTLCVAHDGTLARSLENRRRRGRRPTPPAQES